MEDKIYFIVMNILFLFIGAGIGDFIFYITHGHSVIIGGG